MQRIETFGVRVWAMVSEVGESCVKVSAARKHGNQNQDLSALYGAPDNKELLGNGGITESGESRGNVEAGGSVE
ncbi:hypothetical protein NHQ30_011501 [Ciborinia camelliae]|nr:hypothetical protein NHQ30_011501 [Ciborinia camelliae]